MSSQTYHKAVALAREGLRPADIAERVGCAPGTVHHYLSQARANGEDVPRFRGGPRMRRPVKGIPAHLARALEPHAGRRGLDVATLLKRLIEEIVKADLVDAVLDDAEWLDQEMSRAGDEP